MGILKTWFQSSSIMVKVVMAVSITSAVVVVNKLYYRPYIRRKRHLQAEEWANIIVEQEEALKEFAETR